MTGLEIFMSTNSRRAGECFEASTRDAGCIEDDALEDVDATEGE